MTATVRRVIEIDFKKWVAGGLDSMQDGTSFNAVREVRNMARFMITLGFVAVIAYAGIIAAQHAAGAMERASDQRAAVLESIGR